MTLTKTQRNGALVAAGGATAVAIATGLGGYLFLQNMKVGASPSDLIMQILQLLFSGGGTLTIGGIITTLISWFRNRKNQSSLVIQDATKLSTGTVTPQGINLQGANSAELVELTEAFFAFLKDRKNVPSQKRLITALTGIVDVIPNLNSAVEGDELVFRYKMAILAVSKSVPVQIPLVSKIGEAGNA